MTCLSVKEAAAPASTRYNDTEIFLKTILQVSQTPKNSFWTFFIMRETSSLFEINT